MAQCKVRCTRSVWASETRVTAKGRRMAVKNCIVILVDVGRLLGKWWLIAEGC